MKTELNKGEFAAAAGVVRTKYAKEEVDPTIDHDMYATNETTIKSVDEPVGQDGLKEHLKKTLDTIPAPATPNPKAGPAYDLNDTFSGDIQKAPDAKRLRMAKRLKKLSKSHDPELLALLKSLESLAKQVDRIPRLVIKF